MNKNMRYMTAMSLLGVAMVAHGTASAHMEPKKGDGTEKCYGVAKAGKNDCASAAAKHGCAGMGTSGKDADPKEWVKVPQGLCVRLAGGSLEAKK